MTDLFRGYDLTTVVEAVAHKQYDRLKYAVEHQYPDEPDGSRAKGNPVVSEWENLSPIEKRNLKETLLPIVTDVLEVLGDRPTASTSGDYAEQVELRP